MRDMTQIHVGRKEVLHRAAGEIQVLGTDRTLRAKLIPQMRKSMPWVPNEGNLSRRVEGIGRELSPDPRYSHADHGDLFTDSRTQHTRLPEGEAAIGPEQ